LTTPTPPDLLRLGRSAKGRTRFAAVGVAVAVLAWSALRWTVWPDTVAPADLEPADAVVMFVGGSGERFDQALALMEAGLAPVLVVPNGHNVRRAQAEGLCGGDGDSDGDIDLDFEVLCPVPDPITTQGEARAIGRVAAERGWESVIAVTSTYHIARAELVLGRCFPGRIQAVGAEPDIDRDLWRRLVRHELLGHAAFRTVFRGC
jgi:uncharacterized SAM-binding protein YcdF (DUF218 family)